MYSAFGRPSIDPVVLFKCHFLKVYYGIKSLRRTYEEIEYNNLYRWFLGYQINEKVPNYSTYSKNYERKFKKLEQDLLETFFYKVLSLLEEKKVLDLSNIYIDSTHTKANANKKKVSKQMVEVIASEYKEELDNEIRNTKEYIKGEEVSYAENINNDEQSNHKKNVENIVETKEILKSDIDHDASILYKDEKEKMYILFLIAYETEDIDIRNNTLMISKLFLDTKYEKKIFDLLIERAPKIIFEEIKGYLYIIRISKNDISKKLISQLELNKNQYILNLLNKHI